MSTQHELVLLDARGKARGTAVVDALSPGEPRVLPAAGEVAEVPVLSPCKCSKPAVQTMDYMNYTPDDWSNPEPRINRCCLKCWAHWFGPPTAVRFFTSKDWDQYVSQ